jgi:hypothetical protein
MKIHSDVLTYQDFHAAILALPGVTATEVQEAGSRSRARSFHVMLSGTSPFRTMNKEHQAATWDEWGFFLAHLYSVDGYAYCGKHSYQSAAHFHWVTGDRFKTLTPLAQHRRHVWEPRELVEQGFASTHGYAESRCDCGAVQRWFIGDGRWDTARDVLVPAGSGLDQFGRPILRAVV